MLWSKGSGLTLLASLLVAGGAWGAPITMDPGSVTLDTVLGSGNAFTITFDGGDTSDNLLDFTAHGGGSSNPFLPSTSLAALVFDVDILSADDTVGGLFNSSNVVRGITLPGTGIAAALLVDAGAPSSESFWIQLAGTPSMATFYSLSLDDLGGVSNLSSLLSSVVDSQSVRFRYEGSVAAVPEPSAALVFSGAILLSALTMRRRTVRTR